MCPVDRCSVLDALDLYCRVLSPTLCVLVVACSGVWPRHGGASSTCVFCCLVVPAGWSVVPRTTRRSTSTRRRGGLGSVVEAGGESRERAASAPPIVSAASPGGRDRLVGGEAGDTRVAARPRRGRPMDSRGEWSGVGAAESGSATTCCWGTRLPVVDVSVRRRLQACAVWRSSDELKMKP